MSTQKITSSGRKLEAYSQARERDRAALEIAEREGCSFFEAYLRGLEIPSESCPSLHTGVPASVQGL
jgi:hypothetical protein